MKKMLILLSSMVLVSGTAATVIACGTKSDMIFFYTPELGSENWTKWEEGANNYIQEYNSKNSTNYKLQVEKSDNDLAKEKEKVEVAIQSGAKGVILGPTSDKNGEAAKKVIDADIPLVIADRKFDDSVIQSGIKPNASVYVESDKVMEDTFIKIYEMFVEGQIIEKEQKIKVFELQGTEGSYSAWARNKALKEVEDKGLYETTFSQSAQFELDKAQNVVEANMDKVKNSDIVFAHNDRMAMGAVNAIKKGSPDWFTPKDEKVFGGIVIGFDYEQAIQEQVKKWDTDHANVFMSPRQYSDLNGYEAAKILVEEIENGNKNKGANKTISAASRVYMPLSFREGGDNHYLWDYSEQDYDYPLGSDLEATTKQFETARTYIWNTTKEIENKWILLI